MSRENRVVGLDDGTAHFRSRIDTKLEFRLLAIVGGETLHQQSTEPRSGSTSEGVEYLLNNETAMFVCLFF